MLKYWKNFLVLNIVSSIISFLRVCKLFTCKSINVCSLNWSIIADMYFYPISLPQKRSHKTSLHIGIWFIKSDWQTNVDQITVLKKLIITKAAFSKLILSAPNLRMDQFNLNYNSIGFVRLLEATMGNFLKFFRQSIYYLICENLQ